MPPCRGTRCCSSSHGTNYPRPRHLPGSLQYTAPLSKSQGQKDWHGGLLHIALCDNQGYSTRSGPACLTCCEQTRKRHAFCRPCAVMVVVREAHMVQKWRRRPRPMRNGMCNTAYSRSPAHSCARRCHSDGESWVATASDSSPSTNSS
jgi:hypothetical protein